MNTRTLIADTPAELILGLGLLFALAALILFALSVEAGNYRDLTQWLRDIRRWMPRNRPARRWYFNTGSAERSAKKLTV